MTNIKWMRWVLIVITTFLLSYLLPQLIKMGSESVSRYAFTYYSSVIRQFTYTRMGQQDIVREDELGKLYPEAAFDSILPLFQYRQLVADGRMPDSIHGVPVSVDQIRKRSFNFRLKPRDVDRPVMALYPMYESMSGRVKLEVPADVFRCSGRLEFIDAATNTVNYEKSLRFQVALERAGFQFPARWVAGIPTARKAYDEGYFIKDANGQVFHVKQVNGKPFVINTGIGAQVNALHFSMVEVPDRRFYGFLFDDQQQMYMVESSSYHLHPLPLHYDFQAENIMIMANMLYWNVHITSGKGHQSIALNSQTLERVDEVFQKAETDLWGQLSQWAIPFRIEIEHPHTAFVYPQVIASSPLSLMVSVILAFVWAILHWKQRHEIPFLTGVGWVLVTGIFGFVALLFYRK